MTPAVLATFGRAAAKRSSLLHWSRRAGDHAVAVLDPLGRLGDAPAVAVGAGRDGASAGAGRAGVLDGAGQQHAAPVRADARDPRRRRTRRPRRSAPARSGPVRVLVTFPDGDAASARPSSRRSTPSRQQMAQAPNVVSVAPPVFGDDYRSALLSAVLSVDPEDMGARNTVDWMRAATAAGAGPATAPIDVGGPTALIKDFDDRVSRDPAAGVRVRRADRVRDAADLDPVGVPGAQGRADDGAVGGRRLRQPGDVFQWGWLRGPGLPADLVARQHHPAAGAGDDVRPVDGLRDLPADPHPGAVPADRTTPATPSPTG